MTLAELRAHWTHRREDYARTHATVNGVAVADEILRDLKHLENHERFVTLREAALASGYTPDHLSRLTRQGHLVNYGRKHAPRFRASDLPRKPTRQLVGLDSRVYSPEADARSLGLRR